jgi:hypothetical protein
MSQNITGYDHGQTPKKINTEQVEQIIKAIIGGKYSWACFLMLRFTGCDPIKYIPYRTYIRLLKNFSLPDNAAKKQLANKEVNRKLRRFDMNSDLFHL